MKLKKPNRSKRWLVNMGFGLLAAACGFTAGCDLTLDFDDNGDFDWDEIWDEVDDELDDEFGD